jgi:hypothetical protein
MRHLHYSIQADSGQSVVVSLRGNAANVMLLDDFQYSHYRTGKSFRYFGGHFRASPAVIGVPHSGHWNVVIDLGGREGHVEASVAVR